MIKKIFIFKKEKLFTLYGTFQLQSLYATPVTGPVSPISGLSSPLATSRLVALVNTVSPRLDGVLTGYI